MSLELGEKKCLIQRKNFPALFRKIHTFRKKQIPKVITQEEFDEKLSQNSFSPSIIFRQEPYYSRNLTVAKFILTYSEKRYRKKKKIQTVSKNPIKTHKTREKKYYKKLLTKNDYEKG